MYLNVTSSIADADVETASTGAKFQLPNQRNTFIDTSVTEYVYMFNHQMLTDFTVSVDAGLFC